MSHRVLAGLSVFSASFLGTLMAAAPIPPQAAKSNWPMFGGSPGRNMANFTDRNLPDKFAQGDAAWAVALGSECYTQPVVANGVVLVGTNNDNPRNPADLKILADGTKEAKDRPVLMCFRATDGKFLWQARHERPNRGGVGFWPYLPIVTTPAVEGDRAYYLTMKGEVVCVDLKGLADGNQGFNGEKFTDETDADILWVLDMEKEFGVHVHDTPGCSPLVVGETVFVVTGNGVDESHRNIPAPDAPSFVALDKKTGKLLWKDNSPGKDIIHGQWSSPAYAAEPVPQVIFPGGDGWLRAFDPPTGKLLWKFEGNPRKLGANEKSDFLAAPVIVGGRLYIGTGQDPEHGFGPGHLWCIDLKKAVEFGAKNKDRDVSPVDDNFDPQAAVNKHSALTWHYGPPGKPEFPTQEHRFGRTMSTICIVDGVLYAAQLDGFVHCLDAKTGEVFWVYDLLESIWTSPYYADGKLYVATEGRDLFVFKHDTKPKRLAELDLPANNGGEKKAKKKAIQKAVEDKFLLAKVEFSNSIRSTPAVADGTLYVATQRTLYAFKKKN